MIWKDQSTSLRIRFDSVSPAVDHDRFQVDHQIVIGSRPDDQLNVRTPRNRQTTVVPSDVPIHNTGVDAVIAPLYINSLVCAHGDDGPSLKYGERITIPIAVSVPVLILRRAHA
jgi:hypothetical protein